MNINDFKYYLGLLESGGSYTIKNPVSGALGKYQFLQSTLTALQFKYNLEPWQNEFYFLNNSQLQELYFESHLVDLQQYITSNNITNHLGKIVTGSKRFTTITIPVSMAGLIAGAHLAGPGSLGRYFQTGYDPNDGMTSLTDYMAYFSEKVPGNYVNIAGVGYLIPLVALAFISIIVLYYD